jgi:hypothetical protein
LALSAASRATRAAASLSLRSTSCSSRATVSDLQRRGRGQRAEGQVREAGGGVKEG